MILFVAGRSRSGCERSCGQQRTSDKLQHQPRPGGSAGADPGRHQAHHGPEGQPEAHEGSQRAQEAAQRLLPLLPGGAVKGQG